MSFRVINGKVYPVGNFPQTKQETKVENGEKCKNDHSFQHILNENIKKEDTFVISKHAADRLESRNISFTKEDMFKINEGINKAKDKGARDCLILFKDTALITSIKNRTIITAVDKESSKNNVFTNIDSVVLL